MIERIRKLYDHMWWAHDRVAAAVTDDTPGQLPGLLAHVVAAESVWLARLIQQPPPVSVWPDLDVSGTRQLAAETRKGFAAYLTRLREADLDATCTYRNSAGDTFTTPVADILFHVALHGSYHRGQLARALRQSGVAPASTDYIEFARNAPAARRDG